MPTRSRRLRVRHRQPPQPFGKRVPKYFQLTTREQFEHLWQWPNRKLAEQPRQHTRIDATVFRKGQREIRLGRITGAIQEQQIHEVTRF